jgi:hypothetical protein
MRDRRAADRYRLPLEAVLTPAPLYKGTQFFRVKVCDISASGVYFTSDEPFSIGAKFGFSFTLPTEITQGSEVEIDTKARVVRVDEVQRGTGKAIGIAAIFEESRVSPVAVGFALHKADLNRDLKTKSDS